MEVDGIMVEEQKNVNNKMIAIFFQISREPGVERKLGG